MAYSGAQITRVGVGGVGTRISSVSFAGKDVFNPVSIGGFTANDLEPPPRIDDEELELFVARNFDIIKKIMAPGVTGSFTTTDGKTINIFNGIVVDIT